MTGPASDLDLDFIVTDLKVSNVPSHSSLDNKLELFLAVNIECNPVHPLSELTNVLYLLALVILTLVLIG